MMIRTAGGPGAVNPLDFNDRKQPLPKSAWMAIGLVAAAHVAVGVALYYQRFETPPSVPLDEGTIIQLQRPPLPPEPVVEPKPVPPRPLAPNPPIHQTPAPTTATETFEAVKTDAQPTHSNTLTFTDKVEEPVRDAAPATEPVQPQPPAVITNPSWISQPNAEQMMRAYPSRALNAGVSGSVGLTCSVRAGGSVSDCSVTRETPAGQGFGRAAQGLSRYFRINPRTVNGTAVDGARVSISLRFTAPRD